jgi:holo-[acyl-carrier protein] synthase
VILGTGIDIVEVSRIEQAIQRWGDHFLRYVFCEEEIQYANNHKFPFRHFAGRFAAKEAIFKALDETFLPISWKDIKILNHENGKPYCQINKTEFRYTIHLSISHSNDYAIANAVITA